MANEITYSNNLSFSKGGVSSSAGISAQANMAGSNYVRDSMSVPTSATAIPLGSIATLGWLWLKNLDPANYLTVLTGTSGTAFAKVLPGESMGPIRMGAAAPAVQANTAAVLMDYLAIEG